MKKIKILLLTVTIAIINYSCDNDGGTSALVLEVGAVPNMIKTTGSDPIIDLIRLESGEVLDISFRAELAQGDVVSTDVVAAYVTLAGTTYTTTLDTNVSLPQEYTINTNDIIAAFEGLNSAADIKLGDVLRISTRFTMEDGRVLSLLNENGTTDINGTDLTGTDNTGTTLSNSKLVAIAINYPVSCPSDLGGTYVVSSTGTGCCGVSPITDFQYTVTVTDNGGGVYTLSDNSGGAYEGLFCGAFALCGDLASGDITDVCNTLGGSMPDCCGTTIEFSGIVNEDGTWSVEISSGFMAATQVWTKQ